MVKILMQTKVEPEVKAFFMDAAWQEGKSLSAFLAQWLTDRYHEEVEPSASPDSLIELGRAAGVHLRVANQEELLGRQPSLKKRTPALHVSPHSPPAAPQHHKL
jgi:hypothetical protein